MMYLSISCGCPSPPSLVAITLTQYMAKDFRPVTVKEVWTMAFVLQRLHSIWSVGLISTKYPFTSSSTPFITFGLVQARHKVW